MGKDQLPTFIQHLRRMVGPPGEVGVTDGQLLQRFAREHDEAAFEVLVWRHGPMVLGLCRRMLRNAQDVEDAFQATFLALVRRAGSLHRPGSVGSWLYKVAYRIARRVQKDFARRTTREGRVEDVAAPEDAGEELVGDLRPLLDEEINRLPERYRVPVVLCYLEGKSREEAARQLGCPEGTVWSRLAWARERLRSRLLRRGVVVSSASVAVVLAQGAAEGAIPANLVRVTVKAGAFFAAGKASAPGILSVHAIQLAKGALKMMLLSKVKMVATLVLAFGVLGIGAGAISYRAFASGPASTSPPAAVDPPGEAQTKQEIERLERRLQDTKREIERLTQDLNNVRVPAQREGVLKVIGTEMKPGEKVAAEDTVSVRYGKEIKNYRRLREGDVVEAGQLLGLLDDRLARDELAIRETAIAMAQAERITSEKTRDEAEQRYKVQVELQKRSSTSSEEVRGALLTWERYKFEAVSKAEAEKKAIHEKDLAETILRQHEIRSPARGRVQAIYKHLGEAVKVLETVFLIRIDQKNK